MQTPKKEVHLFSFLVGCIVFNCSWKLIMFDKKQKSCVKRIHLVTDDGLDSQKAFYKVKIVFCSSSINSNINIGLCNFLATFIDPISFFIRRNVKKFKKLTKAVNIEEKNLHIFWKTWQTSMKVSENLWLIIILKVIENQSFTLSL